MLRMCLLAPLCAAVLVKTPEDTVLAAGGNLTYRLWGKVYNASYMAAGQDDDGHVTTEPSPQQEDPPGDDTSSSTTEDTTPVQETQVECVDTEPLVWKGMLNCLRKKRFISCMSAFISRHWRRVATATGRKKALRRFYLPLLLLFFFKFKLLVVVLGMVAALAGKSAIMSVVSLAVAAGLAIKTSLGVHHYHDNKRFDSDATEQTSSSPLAGTFNSAATGSGLYGK